MEKLSFYNFLNLGGKKCLVVGISGATCGGKTTLSKLLQATFPWAKVVHQDAYFHPDDPKHHVYLPKLQCFNWELATALDFDRMEGDVKKLITGESLVTSGTPFFDNETFVRSHLPSQIEVQTYTKKCSDIHLIILEGHIIFNRPFLNDICDQRFFLTLSKEECQRRRLYRKYTPPPPPAFFEECVWPSYEQRLINVQHLDGISFMDAEHVELVHIYRSMKASIANALGVISDANSYNNNDGW